MSSATEGRVTPRSEDYSAWYHDVLREAQLVDSSPVRGCFVLMPRGMALWDRFKADLDERIADTGVVNASFPLLIPLSFLSREADHVEGFAKECALVTHTRLHTAEGGGIEADPDSALQEPFVIRPTSETVIWDSFRKWISTAADLPVLVNQWANVLRWERRTRPFLRTSEFLWQEGHTAHATREEALRRAQRMQVVYRDVVRSCMAVPVLMGAKSPSERFAGAEETLTIEAMMQDGWALQSGTSHFLGTAFSDAFGVKYSDAEGHAQPVWATSWGVSTRLLGAAIMSHSDDIGFVAPPAVAAFQVEVLAIGKGEALQRATAAGQVLVRALRRGGVRATMDTEAKSLSGPGGEEAAGGASARGKLSLGKRRFASERRGTPLRVEIGKRELEQGWAKFSTRVPLDREACDLAAAELFELAHDSSVEPQHRWTMSDVASGKRGAMSEHGGVLAANLQRAAEGEAPELTVVLPGTPLKTGPEHFKMAPALTFAALEAVHATLLMRRERQLKERTVAVLSYDDLKQHAANLARTDGEGVSAAALTGPAFLIAPWKDCAVNERRVKDETSLTIRCLNAGEQGPRPEDRCIISGEPATHLAVFARAY